MRNVNHNRLIIYLVTIITAVLLFGCGMIYVSHGWSRIIVSFLCILLVSMVYAMDQMHINYIDSLLIQLTDMIEQLINTQSKMKFKENEDTLLSKIQMQIEKLSGILIAQKQSIQLEKDQIKAMISDISHQLKTPVATVKMFGEFLEEPDLLETQKKEYLDTLKLALDKLTFLTESMIKMSRLESGVIQLVPKKTGLNELILDVIKQVYYKAKQKNIEICYDVKASFLLNLDYHWSREAVFNVLDNAVKYTEENGNVTISVEPYEMFIRIDITDSGRGIQEEEQTRIFQRFYRGKNTRDTEGIGIGLYLARKIIMDQGGYMKVTSDGKTGSRFSLFLKR